MAVPLVGTAVSQVDGVNWWTGGLIWCPSTLAATGAAAATATLQRPEWSFACFANLGMDTAADRSGSQSTCLDLTWVAVQPADFREIPGM